MDIHFAISLISITSTFSYSEYFISNMKNTIIHGDALELLKGLPDQSSELIIADPPYNIGKDFGINQNFGDVVVWREWCQQWLVECHRILTDQGALFVYGIHEYICYLQVDLMEMGMKYGRLFIWNYENGFSRYTKKPAAHYEPLLWMTKSNDFVYKPIREPYKSKERLKHKIIKNGKVWEPHPEGRLAGDVWKISYSRRATVCRGKSRSSNSKTSINFKANNQALFYGRRFSFGAFRWQRD